VAFEAGRIMLKRLRQLGEAKVDFAFESTLSSRTFAAFLGTLKQQGYAIVIYYFSLTNAQLAVRRVKLRVSLGGHDVPADVVRRRFGRSLSNFFDLYMPLADEWTLFDNSTPPHARTVAAKVDKQLTVTEPAPWHKLQKLSQAV
jgi:predicted ABC-type ATPase